MSTKSSYTSSLSPEYALLGLLAQQPAHGYELHQKLASDLGQVWHVSLSQTYNILTRLEAQGLIQGTVLEQDRLPSRRTFRLSPSGHARFIAWLQAPTGPSVRAIRVEFLTRLYFTRFAGQELAMRLIDEQETEIRRGMQRLQHSLAEQPAAQMFNRLGLELRIRQLGSILAWLDRCRDAVGDAEGIANDLDGK
jgi:DNA-binding PadR family transcriptional regulator